MLSERLPQFVRENYEFHEWKHASAILSKTSLRAARPTSLASGTSTSEVRIAVGGGNKSKIASYVDAFLAERGRIEEQFKTAIEVDGHRLDSPTHRVDCFKNGIALEIEWKKKDPDLRRDLNNFRLLFDLQRSVSEEFLPAPMNFKTSLGISAEGHLTECRLLYLLKPLPRIEGGGVAPVVPFWCSGSRSRLCGRTRYDKCSR